jgi:hypothetical protein
MQSESVLFSGRSGLNREQLEQCISENFDDLEAGWRLHETAAVGL